MPGSLEALPAHIYGREVANQTQHYLVRFGTPRWRSETPQKARPAVGPAPPSGRYRKKCEAEAEARRAFEADCAQRLEDAQRQKEQRLEEEYRQRGEALLAEKRLFEDRTRRDADVRPDTAAVGCAS